MMRRHSKQHLMNLYLRSYETVLGRMNLKNTYFFQCFLAQGMITDIFLDEISHYIDNLIIYDISFLKLREWEIFRHFTIVAWENINRELDVLCQSGVSANNGLIYEYEEKSDMQITVIFN